jgi:hypothetical protein
MQKNWWEETVHTLVAMDDWQHQKQLEDTVRDIVRLAVERAELEGFEQGYEEGKRRAANQDVPRIPGLAPQGCEINTGECVFLPSSSEGLDPEPREAALPGLAGEASVFRVSCAACAACCRHTSATA